MPKISIILSSYNHEKYIAQAIESALFQTFTDFELFIVDDCSQDSSWEVIKSFNDPRIIAVRHDMNKREYLLDYLSRFQGKYVAVHHSDDVWEPDKLEKQVEYLDSHPDTIACFTHVQIIDETSENYTPPEGDFYRDKFEQPNRTRFELLRYFIDNGNCLCHPSVLIRKEAYEKYDLISFGLATIPDFLKWIRVCLNGEIYLFQEKLTKFRLHTATLANASSECPDVLVRAATERFFIYDDLIKVCEPEYFLQVFPEYSGNKVVPEFVFCKSLIAKNNSSVQLYGLYKLFSLLNDDKQAQKIKELHNYTYADFARETGEYDVFSIRDKLRYFELSLYLDCGEGFLESEKIVQQVYIRRSNTFHSIIDIPRNKKVNKIKYLPDNKSKWDISVDSVVVDGIRQHTSTDECPSECFLKSIEKIEIIGEVRSKPSGLVSLFAIEKAIRLANNHPIYLYGAGEVGASYYFALKKKGVNVSGFIVSDGNKNNEYFLECPVYELSSFADENEDAYIVIAVGKALQESIRINLSDLGLLNIIN